MNKEIKKAAALLADKENRRNKAITDADAEKAAAAAELAEIRAKIETASNAEEYKELLTLERDAEAVMQFCEKKAADAHNSLLTAEEYADIVNDARKAFEAVQEANAKSIKAEINRLNEMLAAYDADTAEINALLAKAAGLAGKSAIRLNPQNIAVSDPGTAVYLDAYNRTKNMNMVNNLLKGVKT